MLNFIHAFVLMLNCIEICGSVGRAANASDEHGTGGQRTLYACRQGHVTEECSLEYALQFHGLSNWNLADEFYGFGGRKYAPWL